jgi:hypothetical protein
VHRSLGEDVVEPTRLDLHVLFGPYI